MMKILGEKVKVLIITSTIDRTVDYIIETYGENIDFYRFNVDTFENYEINIGGENQWTISCSEWTLRKNELYSIYYRKPRLPDLSIYEVEYRAMISRDIIAVINGIADDFDGKVLTKPSVLRKTENKVFQLLYAERNGFLTPKSFIGNNKSETREFSHMKSIIKPITTGKILLKNTTEIYQTNYFLGLEGDISLTPIYLQEYMNKKYEVRLTIINGNFFPVRIDSVNKLDWRQNYEGLTYSMIECPIEIKDKCLMLMKHYELNFGAFDFIINENDEWIFLEINPNGQWQWLEQVLRLPISQKIVDYLIS